MKTRKKIAVIGSGITGLTASYFLKDHAEVTLYEKENRLGGHSRTISIQHNSGHTFSLDTGFIVVNHATYPRLIKFFGDLKIELEKAEMSFGVSINDGELEWAGHSLSTFFAQRKRLLSPSMWRGVFDILRFNKRICAIATNQIALSRPDLSLGELANELGVGSWFKNYYLAPLAAAMLLCSSSQTMEFPATTFIYSYYNHGFVGFSERVPWYTLKNKSIDYVNRIEKALELVGTVKKGAIIQSIERKNQGVQIITQDAQNTFDQVVFACHPHVILPLLADATSEEIRILSKFSQQANIAYTHSDESFLPRLKACQSSWNYFYNEPSEISARVLSGTYSLNRLQHIPSHSPTFVTLNPLRTIPKEKVYDVYTFQHHLFDKNALEGTKEIKKIQGINQFWYCGAYLRGGLHESGFCSAMEVVEKILKT